MMLHDVFREEVTDCLRVYILAENAKRKHPQGWRSSPNPRGPEGDEYRALSKAYYEASAALWMATDGEYSKDGFRDVVWEWRYWSVMARKCCWYQRFGTTFRAARTMRRLAAAELAMVKACGLEDIYKSACQHIEEAFPKLKMT